MNSFSSSFFFGGKKEKEKSSVVINSLPIHSSSSSILIFHFSSFSPSFLLPLLHSSLSLSLFTRSCVMKERRKRLKDLPLKWLLSSSFFSTLSFFLSSFPLSSFLPPLSLLTPSLRYVKIVFLSVFKFNPWSCIKCCINSSQLFLSTLSPSLFHPFFLSKDEETRESERKKRKENLFFNPSFFSSENFPSEWS